MISLFFYLNPICIDRSFGFSQPQSFLHSYSFHFLGFLFLLHTDNFLYLYFYDKSCGDVLEAQTVAPALLTWFLSLAFA